MYCLWVRIDWSKTLKNSIRFLEDKIHNVFYSMSIRNKIMSKIIKKSMN